MGSYKPEVQSRLIRDLEPVVGQELERHLATQKEWYPHEYVPWSEGRNFAGPLNGDAWEAKDSKLTAIAQDSLVINLLTEDNFPVEISPVKSGLVDTSDAAEDLRVG